LILGAKCRNCKLPISWEYPLVEAITGILFLLVYLRFGIDLATPVYMMLSASLVIITFQDFHDWTIPNEITYPGIPLGLALSLVAMVYGSSLLVVTDPLDSLLGIILGGGIIYTMDRVTVLLLKKPGMGFGDVKLLAMLGAFLGWKGALGTLMLGSVLGSIIGVSIIFYFKMKDNAPNSEEPSSQKSSADDDEVTLQGHYLPFGPYLALGGLIFMFYGQEMINWYLQSLGPRPVEPLLLP
jgi:leader peptidase (prepilin peptidase)/N-methyltransferase